MEQDAINPTCATCPAWEGRDENVGECRRELPQVFFAGTTHGKPDKPNAPASPVPVFFTAHPTTPAEHWCVHHPGRRGDMLADIEYQALETAIDWLKRGGSAQPLWEKDRGFLRAPTLDEARRYAVDTSDAQAGAADAHPNPHREAE